ncbi:MAG: carbamoyl-phosphate synthase large subunit [Thermovenabulum sp.]|uniref:carbamoyl-phosphate synthase large subunit n=1 Tax=Thermovenabulum sp. TaxID=3100335 RepID=UPI003C7C48FD
MPKDKNIKKVLIIGSGPIVIGQAAEFDYSGTQGCLALKEEGIEVVLLNSNPATIMTDPNIADKVYMEPINLYFAEKIIKLEKPDGILPTLGGQAGLNLAAELYESGILKREKVRLLGTPITAIKKAEDRKLFKELMLRIGEPVPESRIVKDEDEALEFAKQHGFPLIIRPAYTLGGTGGGIAHNERELIEITKLGLSYSRIKQVLVEKSLLGMKEIEYEVIRDKKGQCITVCNMENIDPVGVHTGDSIVVAPSLTLTDKEYHVLRSAAIKIINALKVEGGCNIQFAIDKESGKYYVIEVNPRVSRSSALASKATGYPIAKIAAKIALGYTLDELKNPITSKTAFFEPALDYVVVKIPRFPFDKFENADRTLNTQMKATGEVMAIGRSFESALMKAIRSLEQGYLGLRLSEYKNIGNEDLLSMIRIPTDKRLFAIAEGLRRGIDPDIISKESKIDRYFIDKINNIVEIEKELKERPNEETVKKAKMMGFPDKLIAEILEKKEEEIKELTKELKPSYKMVDTCAGEFQAFTPYFYSSYGEENEALPIKDKKVVVIGSGPIRIGQGIEFDYCSVHAVNGAKKEGYKTVIINNNPETVSTDFTLADRLYFEPLYIEDVLSVIENENPDGVLLQFGGQTAVNLAEKLAKNNVKIFGTSVESIDIAEDREKFDNLLEELKIKRPPGVAVKSKDEAANIALKLGFPVLIRPSYVLGGRAMEIIYSMEELEEYLGKAIEASEEKPILIDKYISGKEVEVDAVSDGEEVLIPGIMEHIERAGIHSGDSIAVCPPRNLKKEIINKVVDYTEKISKALKIKGLINIQFVVEKDEVYVIEVNPRSSRTVPFLSKITNLPIAEIAARVALGKRLKDLGLRGGLYKQEGITAVKMPVFSFSKLKKVEPSLGPEMKSTGEVIGIDKSFEKALYKAFLATGVRIPERGVILATIADKDKKEAIKLLRKFYELGFSIIATEGTARALEKAKIPSEKVNKAYEKEPNILGYIREGRVQIVINTLTKGKTPERDGFKIRRAATESGILCITSLDTAEALYQALEAVTLKPVSLLCV